MWKYSVALKIVHDIEQAKVANMVRGAPAAYDYLLFIFTQDST